MEVKGRGVDTSARAKAVGAPVLRVQGVIKTFGSFVALQDVSLDVYDGEVVAIIGPSGSGKSTLVRCVDLLEVIDGGSIVLDGELLGFEQHRRGLRPLSARRLSAQRRRMGMVFQSFNLFPHMTVLRNVTESQIHVHGVRRADAVSLADDLLSRVGLEAKRGSYPNMLSGGEQQRVAIARALASGPRIMLFDEPTSALDPELVDDVLEVIRDLARSGRTMVLVTHDMSLAKDVADWCVFMQQGRVVESGPPRQIFENPRTERLKAFLARERSGSLREVR